MTRILVIDDDAALRRCVCSVLENAGYEVVEAADGADGLQQYLAAPTAAVIAVSGDPHALTQAQTLTPHTLAKPFKLRHLLAAVQTLLAASASWTAGMELGSDLTAGMELRSDL
jgi:DNA-binding response OmpR family regulator